MTWTKDQTVTNRVLGPALHRRGDGHWYWADGQREPRVQDMSASWHYNFRCRPGYVEVPRVAAENESDLAWVAAAVALGQYRLGAASGDHLGTAVLVPMADWDAWSRQTPIGARWDRVDEIAILTRARELGWNGSAHE